MSWEESYFKFVKLLANDPFITLFLIFGFYLLRRETFGKALIFLSFCSIANEFLKNYFQAPLPPTCPTQGFAFPSGHSQVAFALWTVIAWDYNNRYLSAIISFILLSIGFAMVYFGYHYTIDVIGAYAFGALFLSAYNIFLRCLPENNINTLPLSAFFLAALAILIILLVPPTAKYPKLIRHLTILITFPIGWIFVYNKFAIHFSFKERLLAFIFSIAIVLPLQYYSTALYPNGPPPFTHIIWLQALASFAVTAIAPSIVYFIFVKKSAPTYLHST